MVSFQSATVFAKQKSMMLQAICYGEEIEVCAYDQALVEVEGRTYCMWDSTSFPTVHTSSPKTVTFAAKSIVLIDFIPSMVKLFEEIPVRWYHG